jgi:hypothetical protein
VLENVVDGYIAAAQSGAGASRTSRH